MAGFVPPDFTVPLGLATSDFVLEPLGPEHNGFAFFDNMAGETQMHFYEKCSKPSRICF